MTNARGRVALILVLAVIALLLASLDRPAATLTVLIPGPVRRSEHAAMQTAAPHGGGCRGRDPRICAPAAQRVPPPVVAAGSSSATITLRAGSTAGGDLAVVGPPTVSAAVVDATLRRVGSPLAGLGPYIVAQGRHAGLDPAALLAVVCVLDVPHPLPPALHNVGHLSGLAGQTGSGAYQAFGDWRSGVRSWYALLGTLYVHQWGLHTLDAILPVYAPGTPAGLEARLGEMHAAVTAWRALSR